MIKRTSKKGGFTLVEVVISMMIITILSVGIYNSYIMIIRQTQYGQVRQEVALVGKQCVEEIKGETKGKTIRVVDDKITIGNMTFYRNNIWKYEEDLDLNFDQTDIDSDAIYRKTITLKKSQAKDNENEEKEIELNKSKYNSLEEYNILEGYNIFICRSNEENNKIQDYIVDNLVNPSNINNSNIIKDSSIIKLLLYIEDANQEKIKISVRDSDGNVIISRDDINKDANLYINFSKYMKQSKDDELRDIDISIYNKTDKLKDIFIEKSVELNVNINKTVGKVKIFNNLYENRDKKQLGTLYDVVVNIKKIENTEEEKWPVLFNSQSKENILIK